MHHTFFQFISFSWRRDRYLQCREKILTPLALKNFMHVITLHEDQPYRGWPLEYGVLASTDYCSGGLCVCVCVCACVHACVCACMCMMSARSRCAEHSIHGTHYTHTHMHAHTDTHVHAHAHQSLCSLQRRR